MSQVRIAYFSGTGCTARVADVFEAALIQRGVSVENQEIKTGKAISNGDEDLLVLLFAVHAANAPLPVDQWIQQMTAVNKTSAVVISVPGGGEVFPNKASRVGSIKQLENKGYTVVYEQTIVMPSNMSVATPEDMAVKLLEVLPQRVEKIVDDVMSGVSRRVKINGFDKLVSTVLGIEKKYSKIFGRGLIADEKCTGCGWCERKCPAANIRMHDGKPVFKDQCVMCFGCVYGCPVKAIHAKRLRILLNKNGFDISVLEKKMGKNIYDAHQKVGILLKGVHKYIVED